jgi:hypothetical protein
VWENETPTTWIVPWVGNGKHRGVASSRRGVRSKKHQLPELFHGSAMGSTEGLPRAGEVWKVGSGEVDWPWCPPAGTVQGSANTLPAAPTVDRPSKNRERVDWLMRVKSWQDTGGKKGGNQCCGSGSISTRYGSGSFYHQAKIVRKTLIPTVLWLLYDFLSFKNDVASKSNKQKLWKK